jgi:hypothetical protein
MAIAIGNKSNDLRTLSGTSSFSFAHTQDTGTDRHLLVMIAYPSANTLTGVTYNSVAMTLVDSQTTSTTSDDWSIWELSNPTTGTNNVTLTFSAGVFDPVSSEAISFTGCSGAGVTGFTDTGGPPRSTSLTIAANSVIVCAGIAGAAGTAVTIAGSSRTIDWNNNIFNYHFGGVSALGLSAGATTCEVNSSASCAVLAVELQEAGGATPRRIFTVC